MEIAGYALTLWAAGLTSTLKTTLLAAFGLFHKVYPCGMMRFFSIFPVISASKSMKMVKIDFPASAHFVLFAVTFKK